MHSAYFEFWDRLIYLFLAFKYLGKFNRLIIKKYMPNIIYINYILTIVSPSKPHIYDYSSYFIQLRKECLEKALNCEIKRLEHLKCKLDDALSSTISFNYAGMLTE